MRVHTALPFCPRSNPSQAPVSSFIPAVSEALQEVRLLHKIPFDADGQCIVSCAEDKTQTVDIWELDVKGKHHERAAEAETACTRVREAELESAALLSDGGQCRCQQGQERRHPDSTAHSTPYSALGSRGLCNRGDSIPRCV